MKLKLSLLEKLIPINEHLELKMNLQSQLTNFIKYPFMDSEQNSFEAVIDSYNNYKIRTYLNYTLNSKEFPNLANKEDFRFVDYDKRLRRRKLNNFFLGC